MLVKGSFCSYCGQAFLAQQVWPRTCSNCLSTTYQNPLPVAVVLLPVDDGLLLVRRNIEPGKGKLALPGGFIDVGETWQEACARELFEETGITIRSRHIQHFRTLSAPPGLLLVFGLAEKMSGRKLPTFVPNEETMEWIVAPKPRRSVFPLHTRLMKEYFASVED